MAITAKQALGAFLGATLAATPMAAANAQDAEPIAANCNLTPASSQTPPYPFMDISSVRPHIALQGVERNSTNRVVITFWATNDAQWNRVWGEVRQAADCLHADGVPVSLYRAADPDHIENDGMLSIHLDGEEEAATTVFPRSSNILGATYAEGRRVGTSINPQVAALSYEAN